MAAFAISSQLNALLCKRVHEWRPSGHLGAFPLIVGEWPFGLKRSCAEANDGTNDSDTIWLVDCTQHFNNNHSIAEENINCRAVLTTRQYTLSICSIAGKFSYRLCAGHLNSAVFCCGSAHVKNFQNVSQQQSPPPTHLWVFGDPLYTTRVMIHFRYYRKTKSLTFGLEPPMRRSNWTRKYTSMSQQIPAKFHRDRSTFGEMMAENLFFLVIIEHNHSSVWPWPAKSIYNNGPHLIVVAFRRVTLATWHERNRQPVQSVPQTPIALARHLSYGLHVRQTLCASRRSYCISVDRSVFQYRERTVAILRRMLLSTAVECCELCCCCLLLDAFQSRA